MSKSYIFKFLTTRLRDVFILGLIVSVIMFFIFGQNGSLQYILGLLLGIMNFILLTIGMDLMMNLKPVNARIIHFIFFSLRYLAITGVIVLFILHRNANAFIVVGGLITMQASILSSETLKHLLRGKEG